MPKLTATDLDVSRLLFDLRLCADLVRQFTGWLETDAIATCVTDGLVDRFSCAFARIWLVNRDRTALCLVASSGLYTRLDGSFALVPMGAFKVGKIAQHCIPFLSNRLADEEWVKDREWAIDNKIQGFAGLPLMVKDQAIGVLAVFSHAQMAPEFLEVLQILSMSVTGALASALNHQDLMNRSLAVDSLSEQLANILGRQKLSLLGTEQTLPTSVTQLLVQTAQQLAGRSCHYCRLVYEADAVTLEAMFAAHSDAPNQAASQILTGNLQTPMLHGIAATADRLGGTCKAQLGSNQKVIQLRLRLPYQADLLASANGSPARNSPLSEREQEVIKLLAQGQRDRDIAERLYISERTVKFHVKNMLEKLGVRTRIQAVFEATQKGWLR